MGKKVYVSVVVWFIWMVPLVAQSSTDIIISSYSGIYNGIGSVISLEPGSMHNDTTQHRYYGLIQGADGSTYILMGDRIQDSTLVGTAWDKFTGTAFNFEIQLRQEALDFQFTLAEGEGGTQTITYVRDAAMLERMELPNTGSNLNASSLLDPLMVGVWRRTESYSDPISSFSYVMQYILYLNADGTTLLQTSSAGGTQAVTGGTPSSGITGFWKTENKGLYTRDHSQMPWTYNGEYLVDAQNMMLKQQGGNKLWERIGQ